MRQREPAGSPPSNLRWGVIVRPTRGERMSTLAGQSADAPREGALRRTCYPQWIKSGTRDAGEATYQIRVQEARGRTLMRLDAEQRQLSVFGAGA
jgi:hypothetical protein